MAKSIVRGGQLHLHNLRMIRQVLGTGLLLSFLGAAVLFSFKIYKEVPLYQVQQYLDSYKAHVLLVFRSPRQQRRLHITWHNSRGGTQRVPAFEVVRSPYVKTLKRHLTETFYKSAKASSVVFSGMLSSLLLYWIVKGKFRFRRKTLRGNKLVSPWVLKTLLHLRRKASDITIEGTPLVKNKETSHLLVTGTTGSGKTNFFNTLVPQIRSRGNRALIIDLTGDYIKRYYRPGKDILINPFDERSDSWCLWQDCKTEPQADSFAEACIPSQGAFNDKFWEKAGATVLSTAIQKIGAGRKPSVEKLYDILTKSSASEYHAFFAHTDASPFTDLRGEKTTQSIRSTVTAHIKFFKYLSSKGRPFSMRDWVCGGERDQWVFLGARSDERSTLRPLISALVDTALTTLMTLDSDPKRRLWFIMDELPALNRLPSLESGLAESRKYGGCIVAGIQSVSQFTTVYSFSQAQTMLDLFNTMVFFRNTDPQTTAWISKVLGEIELRESQENLSYGAHAMRDGISLSEQIRQRNLVLPTEVSSLRDLECYLKSPEGFPITKLKMTYKF